MITMKNGKSTVTIIYELLIFLRWSPSKMNYPSFFTNEWVYIFEKKQCFIYCIEIVKVGYLKVISSKSFSLARLWRLQSKMKCISFSILLGEQCWHILTFSGSLGTQCYQFQILNHADLICAVSVKSPESTVNDRLSAATRTSTILE